MKSEFENVASNTRWMPRSNPAVRFSLVLCRRCFLL